MHAHHLACGGRVSDVDIAKDSGLINPNLHHHGDQILADHDFTFQDEFVAACGVELIIPSFMKEKKTVKWKGGESISTNSFSSYAC